MSGGAAPSASPFARAEIEAGRKLFAGDWTFAAAAGSVAALPAMRGVEIAFAGRSNVGKSSLINALTGRRALARTSHTPGRTQELIFFTGLSKLVLVDMPGYGYAAAAKDLSPLIAATTAALKRHPAAYPEVLAASARTGAGIAELRAAIARLLAEREEPVGWVELLRDPTQQPS